MAKAGELDSAEAEYLTSGRLSMNPPPMTAKVQEFLTAKQWANACASSPKDDLHGSHRNNSDKACSKV